jgi:hypothetical protein
MDNNGAWVETVRQRVNPAFAFRAPVVLPIDLKGLMPLGDL